MLIIEVGSAFGGEKNRMHSLLKPERHRDGTDDCCLQLLFFINMETGFPNNHLYRKKYDKKIDVQIIRFRRVGFQKSYSFFVARTIFTLS